MAVRTKRWDRRHSIWLIWVFLSLGLFCWTTFIYIGMRAKQTKWIFWGVIYSIPFVLYVYFVDPNHPQPMDGKFAGAVLAVWPVTIIHAFMIREEYLERLWYLKQNEQKELEQLRERIRQEYEVEGAVRPSSDWPPSPPLKVPPISRDETKENAEPPKTTLIDLNRASEEKLASLPQPMSKERKRWEWLNSIWIAWAILTFGMFNWVSFVYIGLRVRQKKWIYAGIGYAVPAVIYVFFNEFVNLPTLTYWAAALRTAVWPVSIIHAFKVRREYLERLWYVKKAEVHELEKMREQVWREGTDDRTDHVRDFSGYGAAEESGVSPSFEHHSKPSVIDLNRASEEELASLPGMNLILAKNAIKKRSEKGGFSSVEDFAHSLGLKPHVTERIRPRVTVQPLPNSSGPDEMFNGGKGRIVDF